MKNLFRLSLLWLLVTCVGYGQETTAALQGTVKDATGAAIPNATVTVTTPTLVGEKSVNADGKGYYHFSNLPPGAYIVTVTSKGFATLKRQGLVLEVGHQPTVDLTLSVGAETTQVDVTTASPQIDVTSTTSQTNLTQDVIDYVPRGVSFQSVIQFAPAARNEPLMGNTTTNGSGSVSPGNGSNGSPYGYSIAGGADSENSYLVEGQETANLIGGYSHTSVPFDFIDEVQIKTSGVPAEYGGALGGVVDVIMKKGTNHYHGSVFAQYNSSGLNASPNAGPRYNPLDSGTNTSWGFIDPAYQSYQPTKPRTDNVNPGFTLGGPLVPFGSYRDKIFFFVGFNPNLSRFEQKVNYGPTNGGLTPFSQNQNTYYTTARIDAQATKRIRVFGSWLYQLQRENGENLPSADSTQGYFNGQTGCFGAATNTTTNACVSTGVPAFADGHTLGYVAPNITVNTGADITITQNLVATSHFGYYFENYHDFGFPTTGVLNFFETNGIGSTDAFGVNSLPASLQQSTGYYNAPLDQNFTQYNASKAIQFDQDVAFYKSGWAGTHNFKFGYQLIRNSNTIDQHYNEPLVNLYVGDGGPAVYFPSSATGNTNCIAESTATGIPQTPNGNNYAGCQGKYGYISVEDFGSKGHATSFDHGLYFQDSWTIGRGLTVDYGVRLDKEYLPGEAEGATTSTGASLAKPIDFSWGDKIAPRIGAAWDVYRNGKLKLFGDYGKFYDTMKLNLAISSFGGQYWQNCYFALDTSNIAAIKPAFNSAGRYCSGTAPNSVTNFAGGTPAGLTFLESQDFRAFPTTCSTCSPVQEGVAPGLKPYQQHESVIGVDYQLARTVAFEARYDRRRLDRAIEDSSLASSVTGSETFVVVNPGYGVNATATGFCNFLYGTGAPDCTSTSGLTAPNNTIPAARSYDGIELRLNKAVSNHWAGMFSYTYSHFRGNYTGLTSSDIADGGSGGRNAPNNSRSFDEPYFSYNDNGQSSSGLLPTDRPNTLKGYGYYQLKYLHRMSTDFGVFQTAYQGSPNTTYTDVGYSENAFPVDVVGRGKWVNVTQNATTGAITVGNPITYRNPWYTQTDFNVNQTYRVAEAKEISFGATFSNVLNQHAVTAVSEQLDSAYSGNQYITPGGYAFYNGAAFYAAAERPYNLQSSLNGIPLGGQPSNNLGGPETIDSQYGKPLYYQQPRNIRLQAKFTF
jgi:hypothetical protein